MDVGSWLRSLGLERYEAAFRENEVDAAALFSLTAEDLKDLGITLVGHRREILDAIAALKADAKSHETASKFVAAADTRPIGAKTDKGQWSCFRGSPVLANRDSRPDC